MEGVKDTCGIENQMNQSDAKVQLQKLKNLDNVCKYKQIKIKLNGINLFELEIN